MLLVGMQTGGASVEKIRTFLKKSKTELPLDPAIPLLGIYPKETKALKMGHRHSETLLSRKEGNPAVCYMEGPEGIG